MVHKLIEIFLIALFIRLLCLFIIDYHSLDTMFPLEVTEHQLKTNDPKGELMDASDHYYTSIDLQVPKFLQEHYGYERWTQRNWLHVLVLHLTGQSILFQILLSVLTVLMLFKMNKIAGILYALYPQSIIYSCMYTKVTLWVFIVVLIVFIFYHMKNFELEGQWIATLIIVLVTAFAFTSYYNIAPSTPAIYGEMNRGVIDKVVGLWQPSFNHTHIVFGNWIQHIQAPFYILIMFIWIRHAGFNYVTALVIIFTVGAIVQYAHPFHREPLIPLILLDITRRLND